MDRFSRTELIIGKENLEKLKKSKVAVFGIGGVGSYVVEGLARAGVGNFILVDNDDVCLSNINRQIIATEKTLGMAKVDVAKERIMQINPDASVKTYKEFFMPGSMVDIFDNQLDYVVDAIDTVTAKIELIVRAKNKSIPIISCMGTGNKQDPTKFEIADINKTSVCPLAKVIRKELRKRDIKNVKVLFSKEEPIKPKSNNEENVPGSISFVPSVAGLIIAGEVIKDILNIN